MVRCILIVSTIFLIGLMVLAPVVIGLSMFDGDTQIRWGAFFMTGICVLPVLVLLIANEEKNRRR